MEDTRRLLTTHRHHYVVWSSLIVVALLLTWAAATGIASLPVTWVWAGAIGTGWGFSVWAGVRWDRNAPVQNLAGRTLAGIWVGAGIAMTLVGFLGSASTGMTGSALLGVLAAILGAATMATGILQGARRTLAGAVGWWAGSAVIFLFPGAHTLLLMAGLLFVLHLVPGLLLFRSDGKPASALGLTGGAGPGS